MLWADSGMPFFEVELLENGWAVFEIEKACTPHPTRKIVGFPRGSSCGVGSGNSGLKYPFSPPPTKNYLAIRWAQYKYPSKAAVANFLLIPSRARVCSLVPVQENACRVHFLFKKMLLHQPRRHCHNWYRYHTSIISAP